MIAVNQPRFNLGQVVATQCAIRSLEKAQTSARELLNRHMNADFGSIDAEDRQSNLEAIDQGERILSSYTLTTGETLWVITEADRSSTCILCPSDY